ncbi:MAG: hypothetical protein ACYCZX_18405 [Rhodospirillaceae bacterium]
MPQQKIELTFATHPNADEINALDNNAQEILQVRFILFLISFASLLLPERVARARRMKSVPRRRPARVSNTPPLHREGSRAQCAGARGACARRRAISIIGRRTARWCGCLRGALARA